MTCPCQNCPERRLVCHDHCAAYLKYHEECVAIRAKQRAESEVKAVILSGVYRQAKYVKRKPK